jgi:hypothetical protein
MHIRRASVAESIDLTFREFLASHLNQTVGEGMKYPPTADCSKGDLIRAVNNDLLYENSPMIDLVQTMDDVPGSWRFMVPIMLPQSPALYEVEFGYSLEDPTDRSVRESRLVSELHTTQDIRRSFEAHPGIANLYKTVGALLVQRVIGSKGEFFAGIERRYRMVEVADGEVTLNWSQLCYHKELLKTQTYLQWHLIELRKQDSAVPEWMYDYLGANNRRIAAQHMALSALAYTT